MKLIVEGSEGFINFWTQGFLGMKNKTDALGNIKSNMGYKKGTLQILDDGNTVLVTQEKYDNHREIINKMYGKMKIGDETWKQDFMDYVERREKDESERNEDN